MDPLENFHLRKVNEEYIENKLGDIFNDSLNFYASTDDLIKRCKMLFEIQSNSDGVNISRILLKTFKNCLNNVLVIGKNHRDSNIINNSIEFISLLIVNLIESTYHDSTTQISYQNLIYYLFENHKANSESVRYRICQILNKIFNTIKKNQSISESLFKRAQICLLERIRDIDQDVQSEAIDAIKCLQDPKDKYCPVINGLANLLKMPGFNLSSRLKILNCLVLTKSTLNVIKELIYDKNFKIRMKTYEIIINKVPFKLLTNDYLRNLIHKFTNENEFDENLAIDLASKYVLKDGQNILKFIESLDIQIRWSKEEQNSLIKLLCYYFKANETFDSLKMSFNELFDFSSRLEMGTFENVFLCQTISWFFKQEGIIFEQKPVIDEIKRYMCLNIVALTDTNNNSQNTFIIFEKLFDMLTIHQLDQDLKVSLVRDMVTILIESKEDFNEVFVKLVVDNIIKLEPGLDVRISTLIDMVDIFAQSEKDKEVKLKYCLLVISILLSQSDLNVLNDEIEKKIEYFVLPNIESTNVTIRLYAVRSLGLCCLLSKYIAINYILLFFKIVQNDEPEVEIEAVKIIINILLYFDLESSEFIDDEDESTSISYPILIPTIFKYLSIKLDTKNKDVKFIICEGFAKLFVANRIDNHLIMSKLILILFESDNDLFEIKDCLYCFFNVYLKHINNSKLFEKSLFSSIDSIIRLKTNDSNKKFDIKQIASYFSNSIYFNAKNYQLADIIQLKLLEKMISELVKENLDYLSKYLKFLIEFYVDLDYEESRNDEVVEKIVYSCKSVIKRCKELKFNLKPEFKEYYEKTRSLFIKYYNINSVNLSHQSQKHNICSSIESIKKKPKIF